MNIPVVSFRHLARLSDETGLFEHAYLTEPRINHGYCVDDVARGLLVTVREPEPTEEVSGLARLYLRFLVQAQAGDGRFRNRRAVDGSWTDEPGLDDCWGRALWGLGAAVAGAPELAESALACFEAGATQRSVWSRSMAFAAMGAADLLSVRPDHGPARAMLSDAAKLIEMLQGDAAHPWPEPRLGYANAVLPETLVAAGSLLDDARVLAVGLAMLEWLVETESIGSQISVTPVGGWAVGEPRPGFDQQPIEVAALADACARAFDVTSDPRWREQVLRCADWFLGGNDTQVALFDAVSGGGCDGLTLEGRNENQGAESTLAMISTFQQAHRLIESAR